MALSAAFRARISPSDFWLMTPWQLEIALKADSEERKNLQQMQVCIAWTTAALQRGSKFPKLDDLLQSEKPSKSIDEVAIKARLRAYQQHKDERAK